LGFDSALRLSQAVCTQRSTDLTVGLRLQPVFSLLPLRRMCAASSSFQRKIMTLTSIIAAPGMNHGPHAH
jgi:hypothetical protein